MSLHLLCLASSGTPIFSKKVGNIENVRKTSINIPQQMSTYSSYHFSFHFPQLDHSMEFIFFARLKMLGWR